MGAKFTPGPWIINEYSSYTGWSVWSEIDSCIAERWYSINRSFEENERMHANARLIAAAPGMYEALNASLIEHVAIHEVHLLQPHMRGVSEPAIIGIIREALKKADGL